MHWRDLCHTTTSYLFPFLSAYINAALSNETKVDEIVTLTMAFNMLKHFFLHSSVGSIYIYIVESFIFVG